MLLPIYGAFAQSLSPMGKRYFPLKNDALLSDKLFGDSSFTVLGRWAWGPCEAVDVKGNHAYIGNGQTFQVLDLTDPVSPLLIGEYVTASYLYDIRVQDSLAFVATGSSLLIIDVSNPYVPRKLAEVFTGHNVTRLALSDSIVYVAGPGDIIEAIDVSSPANPQTRGSYTPIGGGRYIDLFAARGHLVYMADREFTALVMVDASNPDTLRMGPHFSYFGFPSAGCVSDTLLFICVQGAGIAVSQTMILSVAVPDSPVYLGSVDVSLSSIKSITAKGSTAYVGTSSGEVFTIDISMPSAPVVVNKYVPALSELFGGRAMSTSGSNLVVAQYSGVRVFDTGNA